MTLYESRLAQLRFDFHVLLHAARKSRGNPWLATILLNRVADTRRELCSLKDAGEYVIRH